MQPWWEDMSEKLFWSRDHAMVYCIYTQWGSVSFCAKLRQTAQNCGRLRKTAGIARHWSWIPTVSRSMPQFCAVYIVLPTSSLPPMTFASFARRARDARWATGSQSLVGRSFSQFSRKYCEKLRQTVQNCGILWETVGIPHERESSRSFAQNETGPPV